MTARFYVARSQIWGTWPLASSCPSLRMYRGRSPFWRGRGLSLKYLEKIQVWLIPDKNMGHLRWTAKHVWYCWQLHTQLNNTNDNSLLRFQSNAFNIRVSFSWKSSSYVCFFSPWRYTIHSGCVFYSPLSGFSLLVYEVTSSHTGTRHSR